MNCDCIERVNAKLKEAGHAYQLAPSLILDRGMKMETLLSLRTSWVGQPPKGKKHRSPPAMICTYCPFCRRKTAGNKS